MAEWCKALGIAITQHYQQSHRRQIKAKTIDKKTAEHEQQAGDDSKPQSTIRFDDTSGNFTNRRPGVFGIKLPIQVAVKRHGRTSGKDHAEND